jgi:hypothetical protein
LTPYRTGSAPFLSNLRRPTSLQPPHQGCTALHLPYGPSRIADAEASHDTAARGGGAETQAREAWEVWPAWGTPNPPMTKGCSHNAMLWNCSGGERTQEDTNLISLAILQFRLKLFCIYVWVYRISKREISVLNNSIKSNYFGTSWIDRSNNIITPTRILSVPRAHLCHGISVAKEVLCIFPPWRPRDEPNRNNAWRWRISEEFQTQQCGVNITIHSAYLHTYYC